MTEIQERAKIREERALKVAFRWTWCLININLCVTLTFPTIKELKLHQKNATDTQQLSAN